VLIFVRFLEACEDDDYIPTYDEIVHDSDANLSEDEKTIEKQEEFEHKFNFRFEEPDKEFVSSFLYLSLHNIFVYLKNIINISSYRSNDILEQWQILCANMMTDGKGNDMK
jgi:hypothetical protein